MNTTAESLNYYSFFLGSPGTRKRDWQREDLKMPARNVREAIILHTFQFQLHYKFGKNFIVPNLKIMFPDQQTVFLRYRMIYEYERSRYKKTMYSRHTYKKVNEYPVHRIKHLFQKIDR